MIWYPELRNTNSIGKTSREHHIIYSTSKQEKFKIYVDFFKHGVYATVIPEPRKIKKIARIASRQILKQEEQALLGRAALDH